jgi:hypothetical protein
MIVNLVVVHQANCSPSSTHSPQLLGCPCHIVSSLAFLKNRLCSEQLFCLFGTTCFISLTKVCNTLELLVLQNLSQNFNPNRSICLQEQLGSIICPYRLTNYSAECISHNLHMLQLFAQLSYPFQYLHF